MGLLDTIDRLNTSDEQPERPKARITDLPNSPVGENSSPEDNNPQIIWRADPTEIEERRRLLNRKPEHLSFLSPCPVCGGREFMHLEGVGFRCRTCTPWNVGYPVLATGPGRPAPNPDAELQQAGENNDVAAGPQTKRNKPTEEQLANFSVAWPWITKNRAELMEAGWTMAALVRRAKCRRPYGSWGLAWLPIWNKADMAVTIGQNGEILFTFQSGSRTITQVAKPLRQKRRS